jgi:hypothetical protein
MKQRSSFRRIGEKVELWGEHEVRDGQMIAGDHLIG